MTDEEKKKNKKASLFKKGVSGNPNGRPKGGFKNQTGTKIKTSLKNVLPEALDTLLAYMRECTAEAKEQRMIMDKLVDSLTFAEPEDVKSIARQIKDTNETKMLCEDRAAKASIKLVDMAYSVVKEEDKLEISKRKLSQAEQSKEEVIKVASVIAPSISLNLED